MIYDALVGRSLQQRDKAGTSPGNDTRIRARIQDVLRIGREVAGAGRGKDVVGREQAGVQLHFALSHR
ncbi:MAG TPA: hypothetical protein VL334_07550 [Anaerolineae bacterium]|nr:hypothetical protein [Anaerolineae bacterium]